MGRFRWSTIFGALIFVASIATIGFSVSALQEQDRQSRLIRANAPSTLTAVALLYPSPTAPPPTLTRIAPPEATVITEAAPTNVQRLVSADDLTLPSTEVLGLLASDATVPFATNTTSVLPTAEATMMRHSTLDLIASTPLLSVTAFPSTVPLEIADASAGQPASAPLAANPPTLSLRQQVDVIAAYLAVPGLNTRSSWFALSLGLRFIFFPIYVTTETALPAANIQTYQGNVPPTATLVPANTLVPMLTDTPLPVYSAGGGESSGGAADNPPGSQPNTNPTNPPPVPPTSVPPTSIPPTREPPTSEPPTSEPPSEEPPSEEPPSEEPPSEEPPSEEPPSEEPPSEEPPSEEPNDDDDGDDDDKEDDEEDDEDNGGHKGMGSDG